MEQTAKQQIVERVKQATNILVTVSTNPSVDQLAACIGLTLMLNKMDKHATAVFSGQAPSTIEFLQPETRTQNPPLTTAQFGCWLYQQSLGRDPISHTELPRVRGGVARRRAAVPGVTITGLSAPYGKYDRSQRACSSAAR